MLDLNPGNEEKSSYSTNSRLVSIQAFLCVRQKKVCKLISRTNHNQSTSHTSKSLEASFFPTVK